MPNENWINEAFEKAQKDIPSTEFAVKIRAFLDSNTPEILNKWTATVGDEMALHFAKVLAANDSFSDAVETLTECFTVAGYILAKMENNNQQ